MATYHPHKQGVDAEMAARVYLEKQGLTFITKNFHTRMGELDLVMREEEVIVFVEVRSRSRIDYGSALESIDEPKIRKLTATATCFLQKRGWLETKISRFDVIAIDIKNQQMQFEWVKNAF